MNIRTARLQAFYLIRRGGLPGCLGALCLVAALVFFVLEVMPATVLILQHLPACTPP